MVILCSILNDWYGNNQSGAWKTLPHKLVMVPIHQDFVEITWMCKIWNTILTGGIHLKWAQPCTPEMCRDRRLQWKGRRREDWGGLSKIWGAVSRIGGEIGDWSLVWPPSSFFFLSEKKFTGGKGELILIWMPAYTNTPSLTPACRLQRTEHSVSWFLWFHTFCLLYSVFRNTTYSKHCLWAFDIHICKKRATWK